MLQVMGVFLTINLKLDNGPPIYITILIRYIINLNYIKQMVSVSVVTMPLSGCVAKSDYGTTFIIKVGIDSVLIREVQCLISADCLAIGNHIFSHSQGGPGTIWGESSLLGMTSQSF